MKTLKIIIVLTLLIVVSCKDEKQKPIKKDNKITAKINHYICANNCENSGGDAAGICRDGGDDVSD